MPNAIAPINPRASTAKAPNLPESLRRLLADPFQVGETVPNWVPPTVPPESSKLRTAATELDGGLKAASPGHMQWCINKLFVLPTRAGTATAAAFQADNFIDACGHFPDDMWSAGTLTILQTSTFRPSPAELFKICSPKFSERQRMLERVKLMLHAASQPERPKALAPPRTAQADRLKRIMAEQLAAPVSPEVKLFNTANTERALAFAERRPMATWAWQFFTDREAARGGQSHDSLGKAAKQVSEGTARRMAELAAASHQPKRPPPVEDFSDIPEVDHA